MYAARGKCKLTLKCFSLLHAYPAQAKADSLIVGKINLSCLLIAFYEPMLLSKVLRYLFQLFAGICV